MNDTKIKALDAALTLASIGGCSHCPTLVTSALLIEDYLRGAPLTLKEMGPTEVGELLANAAPPVGIAP